MNEKLQHATIILERSYRAPLERIFSEFANPVARVRWSPPSLIERWSQAVRDENRAAIRADHDADILIQYGYL